MTDEEFPRLLKRYKNQLNRFDLEALTTAVTAVYKLEREFSGDPNKIAAAIMKAHPKISAKPSREEICALRCAELAKFYSRVSDGNAGVDQNAKVVDLMNWRNVLLLGQIGCAPTPAQRLAMQTSQRDLLTPDNLQRVQHADRIDKAVAMATSRFADAADGAHPSLPRPHDPLVQIILERCDIKFN